MGVSTRLLHGDCLELLATLPAESIDACVTDPPYGIGFMGKEWDTFKPENVATEFDLRQRKEFKGGTMSANIKGRKRSPAASPSQVQYDYSATGLRGFQAWTEQWAREVLRVLKPGGHAVVCGAPRAYHRMACGLEDAGFEIRDCLAWLFGQGFPKSLNLSGGLGTALKPAHEPIVLARKPFKGTVKANVERFGTGALNIDACRIETSGDESLDGGRISAKGGAFDRPWQYDEESRERCRDRGAAHVAKAEEMGRWPANVCLDEIAAMVLDEQSGECPSAGKYKDPYPKNASIIHAATFEDGWAQFTGGYWAKIVTPEETYPVRPDGSLCEPVQHRDRAPRTAFDNGANRNNYYPNDTGGASRFYYVAKPSREERDYGTDGLQAQQRDASRKAGNPGGDNPRNRGLQPRGNHHPTVKPVELMRWLVKLVTPIGGTVLDPFMGSGTTGMACRYEQRDFIGIEREAAYLAIAQARIAAVAPLFAQAEAEPA